MGDVANILGLKAASVSAEETLRLVTEGKPKYVKTKVAKPAGMARELFLLVSDRDGAIAPSVQPTKPIISAPAYKTKRATVGKGKWNWVPFSNSGRTDNKEFYHWQRADIQYTDYPYAKFNIKMEPIRYTDEEYALCLTNSKWSRSETDYLMHVTHKYDMRWPVITDRYAFIPARRTEEIQERYLDIVTKLNNLRAPPGSSSSSSSGSAGAASEDTVRFAVKHETERRQIQNQSQSAMAAEEAAIMRDIQAVEGSIRGVKGRKRAAAVAARRAAAAPQGGAMVEADPNIVLFTESEALEIAADAAATAAVTADGASSSPVAVAAAAAAASALEQESLAVLSLPCLQSTRLRPPEANARLSNVLLQKLQILLLELGVVSTDLLPTMAVCDLYDLIRRDAVALLSIKSEIVKKTIELQTIQKNTTGGGANTSGVGADGSEGNVNINVGSTLFLKRRFPLPSAESIARASAATNSGAGSGSSAGSASGAISASGVTNSSASVASGGGSKAGTKGRGTKAARANAVAATASGAAGDASAESLELLKQQFKQKKNKRGSTGAKRKHSDVDDDGGEMAASGVTEASEIGVGKTVVKNEPDSSTFTTSGSKEVISGVADDSVAPYAAVVVPTPAAGGQKKGKRMKTGN